MKAILVGKNRELTALPADKEFPPLFVSDNMDKYIEEHGL